MQLLCYANAIYLMDKAYVDFEALFRINSEIYCEIVQINYGIHHRICFSQSLNILYIGMFNYYVRFPAGLR
jgi:hypothetical protein